MGAFIDFIFWFLVFYILFTLIFNPVTGFAILANMLVVGLFLVPIFLILMVVGVMVAIALDD
jgi:hypothetical protein